MLQSLLFFNTKSYMVFLPNLSGSHYYISVHCVTYSKSLRNSLQQLSTNIGYTFSVPWREVAVCFSPMSMQLSDNCSRSDDSDHTLEAEGAKVDGVEGTKGGLVLHF